MSRGEVEVDIWIFEPPRMVFFQFVDTQIVEHQMEFIAGMLGHERVKEAKELVSAFARKAVCFNLPGGYIQSRKEVGRAMSFILVRKAGKRPTIGSRGRTKSLAVGVGPN